MATEVQVVTGKMDKTARIVRACLTAAKAAKELGYADKADEFVGLKNWANDLFDKEVQR